MKTILMTNNTLLMNTNWIAAGSTLETTPILNPALTIMETIPTTTIVFEVPTPWVIAELNKIGMTLTNITT